MSKIQKIWLWIFGAMFLIPETLFLTTPSSIINYTGKDFLTLIPLFVGERFFINNPSYFLSVLVIELVAIMGLLIMSIKNRKTIFSIFLIFILFWLLFVFFLGYVSSTISLVI
jgi:hypothetical protein